MSPLALLIIGCGFIGIIMHYSRPLDIKNPTIIFNIIWIIVIFLLQINTMNWYSLSNNTYMIALLGLISFNIGSIYSIRRVEKFGRVISDENNDILKMKYSISGKKLLFIQVILFLLCIPMVSKAITFISLYGWEMMRTIYSNGIEFGYMSSFQRLFYIHLIVFPLIQACFYMQAILCVRGEIPIWHLFFSLLNVLSVIIITAGRWDIIYFFIVILFAYMLNKKKSKKYIKKSKKIGFIITALIVIIVFTTVLRHGVENNFIYNIINIIAGYLCCGMALLDNMLKNTVESGLDVYLFGLATMRGFFSSFALMIQAVTFGKIIITVPNVQEYAGNFFMVGENESMNAYVTWYYYFMRDFGVFGVIIITAIVAFISMKIYKKVKFNPTFKNQLMYLHMVTILLFSSLWWELMRIEVGARILHTLWLFQFVKNRNLNK